MNSILFGATIIVALAATMTPAVSVAAPADRDSTISPSGRAQCENLAKSFPGYAEYVKYKNLIVAFQELTFEDSQVQDNMALEVAGDLRNKPETNNTLKDLISKHNTVANTYRAGTQSLWLNIQGFQREVAASKNITHVLPDGYQADSGEALDISKGYLINQLDSEVTAEEAVANTDMTEINKALQKALPYKFGWTSKASIMSDIPFQPKDLHDLPTIFAKGNVVSSKSTKKFTREANYYVSQNKTGAQTVILEICDSVGDQADDSPFRRNCTKVDILTGKLIQSANTLKDKPRVLPSLDEWLALRYFPDDDDSPTGQLRTSYEGCLGAQTLQTQNDSRSK